MLSSIGWSKINLNWSVCSVDAWKSRDILWGLLNYEYPLLKAVCKVLYQAFNRPVAGGMWSQWQRSSWILHLAHRPIFSFFCATIPSCHLLHHNSQQGTCSHSPSWPFASFWLAHATACIHSQTHLNQWPHPCPRPIRRTTSCKSNRELGRNGYRLGLLSIFFDYNSLTRSMFRPFFHWNLVTWSSDWQRDSKWTELQARRD